MFSDISVRRFHNKCTIVLSKFYED